MIERIDIFAELGVHLRSFGKGPHTQRIIDEAIEQNEWFNREDILLAIDAICELGLTLRSGGIARHNSGITSLLHSVQHIGRGTELRIQITGTSALQRIES